MLLRNTKLLQYKTYRTYDITNDEKVVRDKNLVEALDGRFAGQHISAFSDESVGTMYFKCPFTKENFSEYALEIADANFFEQLDKGAVECEISRVGWHRSSQWCADGELEYYEFCVPLCAGANEQGDIYAYSFLREGSNFLCPFFVEEDPRFGHLEELKSILFMISGSTYEALLEGLAMLFDSDGRTNPCVN